MKVTRHRRSASGPAPERRRTTRRVRVAAASTAALTIVGGGIASAATGAFGNHTVGTQYANGLQISDNQVIKPIGDRIMTQYGKFMGSTVSADGRFLAASSADKKVVLQVFDLAANKLIYRVGKAAGVDQTLSDGSVGQEGPTYSPDGKFLWLSQQDALTRFPVNADGTLGTATRFPLPQVDGHSALPGKSVYSPDGSTLYVAVNGQNTVVAIDPATGTVKQTWKVGIAPRHLTFVGGKLYVSNEGGRHGQAGRAHDQLLRHRRPGRPLPRRLDDRHRQRHRHRGPVQRRQVDRRRPAPDRAVCRRQRALRRQHQQRHGVGRRHPQGRRRPDHRDAAVAQGQGGLRAHRHRADQGRASAGHPRPGERRRRLPLRRHAAGAGQLRRPAADRLLPRPTSPRSATGSSSPTPAASTPAVRPSPRTRATASPSSAVTTRTAPPRP